jgi:hypothetical protein
MVRSVGLGSNARRIERCILAKNNAGGWLLFNSR